MKIYVVECVNYVSVLLEISGTDIAFELGHNGINNIHLLEEF